MMDRKAQADVVAPSLLDITKVVIWIIMGLLIIGLVAVAIFKMKLPI